MSLAIDKRYSADCANSFLNLGHELTDLDPDHHTTGIFDEAEVNTAQTNSGVSSTATLNQTSLRGLAAMLNLRTELPRAFPDQVDTHIFVEAGTGSVDVQLVEAGSDSDKVIIIASAFVKSQVSDAHVVIMASGRNLTQLNGEQLSKITEANTLLCVGYHTLELTRRTINSSS